MSFYIELFGYLGSFLVVVSMLMASVVKLRIINITGSLISGIYALIIGSFPLALMNTCLIIINVFNLIRLLKASHEYEVIKGDISDAYFQYFVTHYENDIKKFFPDFSKNNISGNILYYVFCNEAPAGFLLGTQIDKGVDIIVDYTVPAYRDCSVAKYLYLKMAGEGIDKLVCKNPSGEHTHFLQKMGFVKNPDEYVKMI